eukprot:3015363-Lingulodinium_polyedra.AAC.1
MRGPGVRRRGRLVYPRHRAWPMGFRGQRRDCSEHYGRCSLVSRAASGPTLLAWAAMPCGAPGLGGYH